MQIAFPQFTGLRCLMMPYIQGEPDSVPVEYCSYSDVISSVFMRKGDIGFLTIDESVAVAGKPHRGKRAKFPRALHTEAGRRYSENVWGGGWGDSDLVALDADVEILLANSLDGSCAVWDAVQRDTSRDGDIGYLAGSYPYSAASLMKAGEVRKIGIFTPHESLPVKNTVQRQFLRIVSSGVRGREHYFTQNPLVELP
jgi:hypothetical protein